MIIEQNFVTPTSCLLSQVVFHLFDLNETQTLISLLGTRISIKVYYMKGYINHLCWKSKHINTEQYLHMQCIIGKLHIFFYNKLHFSSSGITTFKSPTSRTDTINYGNGWSDDKPRSTTVEHKCESLHWTISTTQWIWIDSAKWCESRCIRPEFPSTW